MAETKGEPAISMLDETISEDGLIDFTDKEARAPKHPDLRIVDAEGSVHLYHRALWQIHASVPLMRMLTAMDGKLVDTIRFEEETTRMVQLLLNIYHHLSEWAYADVSMDDAVACLRMADKYLDEKIGIAATNWLCKLPFPWPLASIEKYCANLDVSVMDGTIRAFVNKLEDDDITLCTDWKNEAPTSEFWNCVQNVSSKGMYTLCDAHSLARNMLPHACPESACLRWIAGRFKDREQPKWLRELPMTGGVPDFFRELALQ